MHVSPEFPLDFGKRFEFDAVASVLTHKSDLLVFHGIEITGRHLLDSSTYELLERETPYCDFLWLAFHGRPEQGMEYIPEHVGLMVTEGHGIQVIRPAQRSQHSGRNTGDLAKGLLLKVFNHY